MASFSSVRSACSWAGVVCESLPASQLMRVSGDLCKAAPPLEACRIMACTSWTAALCFLMMCGVLAGQAPAMCVHESGAPHSRHAGVGWWP